MYCVQGVPFIYNLRSFKCRCVGLSFHCSSGPAEFWVNLSTGMSWIASSVRKDHLCYSSGTEPSLKVAGSRVGVLRSIPREGLFSFQKVIADFRQTPATCFGSFSLRKRPGPYGTETWGFQKVIQQRLEDRIRSSLTLPLPYMGVFWASHVSSLGTSVSLLNRGECSMCTQKACAGDLIIYLFTI